MNIITKLMTADELLNMPDDGFRYELIDGALKRKFLAGRREGALIIRLAALLSHHVNIHSLGETYAAGTGFQLRATPTLCSRHASHSSAKSVSKK